MFVFVGSDYNHFVKLLLKSDQILPNHFPHDEKFKRNYEIFRKILLC